VIRVRVYQISGIDEAGAVVDFSTTDNPALAINRLQEARARYLRAWVSDESGLDINVPSLINLAAEEAEARSADRE
jgi:tRNA G26 N,N-dimethylase Trm1